MNGVEFLRTRSREAPWSRMHPRVAEFFREFLADEKITPFAGGHVLNTHFPPYPSRAFDRLAAQYNLIGAEAERRLYSVTLAVTNRCRYRCWHCYNAGRSQSDLTLDHWRSVAAQLDALGAVVVTVSGGEPLLRSDLEAIVRCFGDDMMLKLNTTGDGLNLERARRLKEAGLFAVGVSLDAVAPEEHDRGRGIAGAHATALRALRIAAETGLYPYVIALATEGFLANDNPDRFMRFAAGAGAREVHLLEPCATGRLSGRADVRLDSASRRRLLELRREAALRPDWPALSTLAHLESPAAFGCGAGLTHLYIDGTGEVCPCNLVPLSFGTVGREPLTRILARMRRHFRRPRPSCIGRLMAGRIPPGRMPLSPTDSQRLCAECLPARHALPRFFAVKAKAVSEVGRAQLEAAYDRVHGNYDESWLSRAGRPVERLIGRLSFRRTERVFEAGCGTGYASVRLACRLEAPEQLLAVDLSSGMLRQARQRARREGVAGIRFVHGDALTQLSRLSNSVDLIFTSWVLGYIPLQPFLAAARAAARPDGRLAFVVHRQDSPAEPTRLFAEMVAETPALLERRVRFDFPRDREHLVAELSRTGWEVEDLIESRVRFPCRDAPEVLEHLLNSGAGTAFYEAVSPRRRPEAKKEFVRRLAALHPRGGRISVVHEYFACVARLQPH